MICIIASRLQNRPRSNRTGFFPNKLWSLAAAAFLLAAVTGAQAQFSNPSSGTQVKDTSALHPPAGARVAIVEFADMQCPDCARAYPVVKEAVAKYKIPWIYHDFPLPYHTWSPTASVNARWFETKRKGLGEEYRGQVFANQATFYYNVDLFNKFTVKFAKEHGIEMPFAVDPQGKLTAEVKEDRALGERVGIDHTPTIWVVTANSKGAPFIEVTDRSKLYQIIDQALADTAGSATKPIAKHITKTGAK
jgi:protein-disulfide isomerase